MKMDLLDHLAMFVSVLNIVFAVYVSNQGDPYQALWHVILGVTLGAMTIGRVGRG